MRRARVVSVYAILGIVFAGVAIPIHGGAARAETRTFVIASSPDAYGVDKCLVTGARCGTVIANSYCQSRDYARAASFRRVASGEITGSLAEASRVALTAQADDLVAIECAR